MEVPHRHTHSLVSWKERISYAVSDFACNLSFQMIGTYLMFFYTDVLALPQRPLELYS